MYIIVNMYNAQPSQTYENMIRKTIPGSQFSGQIQRTGSNAYHSAGCHCEKSDNRVQVYGKDRYTTTRGGISKLCFSSRLLLDLTA